jgi:hypothetical protein
MMAKMQVEGLRLELRVKSESKISVQVQAKVQGES